MPSLAEVGSWKAQLARRFASENGRTVLAERSQEGPLVVQKMLYPEGPGVCHAIVVHPPGGIAGGDELSLEVKPLEPDREQKRLLRIRLDSVTVHGPLAKEHWVQPKDYARFFPRAVPKTEKAQRAYAEELLGRFATRAFRRPIDDATTSRLAALAEGIYSQPGNTFEAGIAQAMVAVLASPRFIFREESTEPMKPGQAYPLVDEYALASRLSYFFWSSMPDGRLMWLTRW